MQGAKLNSAFLRNARSSLAHRSLVSRPIAQETLQKWERSARDSTYIGNQAAVLSHCLAKVQETHLDVIQEEKAKG